MSKCHNLSIQALFNFLVLGDTLGLSASSEHKLCTLQTPQKAGANQPVVHWFLGGKGLGIQQGTNVWVGSPKSTLEHAHVFLKCVENKHVFINLV